MMKMCRFGTKVIDCDLNFTGVLTDEGLCCVFNAIHPKLMFNNFEQSDHVNADFDNVDYMTWSPESGFDRNDGRRAYPNPVPGNFKIEKSIVKNYMHRCWKSLWTIATSRC